MRFPNHIECNKKNIETFIDYCIKWCHINTINLPDLLITLSYFRTTKLFKALCHYYFQNFIRTLQFVIKMTFEFNRIIKEENGQNNLVQNHSCKGLENEQITSSILKK